MTHAQVRKFDQTRGGRTVMGWVGALATSAVLALSAAALTAPSAVASDEAALEGVAISGFAISHDLANYAVSTNTFWIETDSGDRYEAYCVEFNVPGRNEAPMREVGWAHMPGHNQFEENAEYVNWILNNSYPAVATGAVEDAVNAAIQDGHFHDGLSDREAVTATQAAIWHYSDGMDFRQVNGIQAQHADSDVRRLYSYLTNTEINVGLGEEPQAAAVELTAENVHGVAGELVGPFVIQATREVESLSINRNDLVLVDGQGQPVNLDAAPIGEPIFIQVPAGTAAGDVTVTAEINAVPVAGRLFVGDEVRTQSMVIAQTDSYVAMRDEIRLSWEAPAVVTPELGTTALDKADGDKVVEADGVVVDEVRYSGLTAGQEYTVKGELMDKSTGQPTGVTAETTFTAEAADGVISLEFHLTAATAGKELVVFERLYLPNGELVAEHTDINSDEQSVTVEAVEAAPVPTPTPTPTETATPTPAPSPTDTGTPAPSPTETATPAPTPSETAAPTPTETATPAPATGPTDAATPAPQASAPAAAPETEQDEELAYTGARSLGLAGGALLLLAAGAVVLFLNRRRKG